VTKRTVIPQQFVTEHQLTLKFLTLFNTAASGYAADTQEIFFFVPQFVQGSYILLLLLLLLLLTAIGFLPGGSVQYTKNTNTR
jgi:hypothetical protein